MSSFFTLPASQRKRKRTDAAQSNNKRNATTDRAERSARSRQTRDESISGSESEGEEGADEEMDEDEGTSGSENEDETAAERRLRLAERYLENVREEVDDYGFDAAEIDRDMIAERLKEDVAETKGRMYRRIADSLGFSDATCTQFRADTLPTTSIATCAPYAYTVSKDMTLIKWELPTPPSPSNSSTNNAQTNGTKKQKNPPPARRRPKQIAFVKGDKNFADDTSYLGHTDQILTVAASQDGKFVATGGRDRRLVVWNATDLTPLRVFTQHRDAVTGLAFRRGTNQLYSGSKDRTLKTWSLDELAYVETLFGHQDEVVDVDALAQERCVSVGARDRTARLWKVVEESQLVFRGGGSLEKKSRKEKELEAANGGAPVSTARYGEGSMDRIAMVDEETFVTGSDNGSISLWSLQKKKPLYTVHVAHGLNPPLKPEEASAEQNPDPIPPGRPQPRWITALATIPFSDVILSGSSDGYVRVWRIGDDKKSLEPMGVLGGGAGGSGDANGLELVNGDATGTQNPHQTSIRGVVNDIAVFERGDRGRDGACVVAAVGTEHRFGRWIKLKGKNGAVVFEVPKQEASKDVANSEE
ncbi:WD40 repeat-like protein [Xylona heveae TC161]|uniref:WD40 repeat-like protein n=1 Tax=Xylona heveae (strain CBS 132557 / TC161) TaxID=1328760 RepID=A0A165IA04_XYLHT|nr:WD40 repeat-like protein [Xylona heveae TC161]KZF24605.1 WD40 repeat-like protein [Xylona heveae TC161]